MIPQRTDCIAPFLVMDILEAAQRLERCGHPVIHLEIGEPDFDTPECVKEAACKAIRDGRTHSWNCARRSAPTTPSATARRSTRIG